MMKLRKLTSDRNVVTFITVPRTLESALCQFSDSQFKMSNFVVNQSHFKSIYDGIIDLTKMVQGNDSFFLCQIQSGRFLEARVKTGRSFQSSSERPSTFYPTLDVTVFLYFFSFDFRNFNFLSCSKRRLLEDFELGYFFPFGKNGPHENYVIYSRPFSIFCIMFGFVLKLFIIGDAENIREKKTKTINES